MLSLIHISGVPGNWDSDNNVFRKFKDAEGKVPRQAARFRVFEFDDAGNPVKEVTLAEGVKIEWRVHVANRKASFFSFHGQSGAETNPPYTDRDKRPPDSVERKERGRGAVSYTHLDVYKRQGQASALQRELVVHHNDGQR